MLLVLVGIWKYNVMLDQCKKRVNYNKKMLGKKWSIKLPTIKILLN